LGRTRCPIGFRPFQILFAIVSLTMTTLPGDAASAGSKLRPATIGTRIVAK